MVPLRGANVVSGPMVCFNSLSPSDESLGECTFMQVAHFCISSVIQGNILYIFFLNNFKLCEILFYPGTIYEGTSNIQLSTIAKFIDQEY